MNHVTREAIKGLYAVSKQRAKRQNSKFNLTYDQFKTGSLNNCSLCKHDPDHIKISNLDGSEIKYNKLHRLDRKLEFNSRNSLFLCESCYRGRNNFDTMGEFKAYILRVINHQPKRKVNIKKV